MKGTWFCEAQNPVMKSPPPSSRSSGRVIFRIKKKFLIAKKVESQQSCGQSLVQLPAHALLSGSWWALPTTLTLLAACLPPHPPSYSPSSPFPFCSPSSTLTPEAGAAYAHLTPPGLT